MRLPAAALALLLTTSCMTEPLTVHMDYISHATLASTYVGSPDPLLDTALVGQRLIISWWVPLCYKDCSVYEIRLKLRYGNRQEAEAVHTFTGRQGWYVYALTNEDYFEKRGIKTYYVQLYGDGELIDEWKHQLWVELIAFEGEAPREDDVCFDEDEDDECCFVPTLEADIDTRNDDEVQIVKPRRANGN